MNARVVSKIGGRLRTRGRPSFNTVLIYEDLNSGKRSWNFYEELTRRFEEDFEFSHLMWSFSMLSESQTLHLAARSAADANLVILSSNGATKLPATVKDWVERWGEICGQPKLGAGDVDGSQGESRNGRLDAFLSAPGCGIPQNRFLPALHLRPSNEPLRVECMISNSQRAYGSFMRSFTLPEAAAGDKVSADFKDAACSKCIRRKAQRQSQDRSKFRLVETEGKAAGA